MMTTGSSYQDRILKKIFIDENGCWNWTGFVHPKGYGLFGYNGKTCLVHRVSYLLFRGSIEDGLTIDHLCRNRKCINPEHLEPVDQRTNVLRGETIAADNISKNFCIRGHSLSGDNLVIRKDGNRECRECRRRRSKEYRERIRNGGTKCL